MCLRRYGNCTRHSTLVARIEQCHEARYYIQEKRRFNEAFPISQRRKQELIGVPARARVPDTRNSIHYVLYVRRTEMQTVGSSHCNIVRLVHSLVGR